MSNPSSITHAQLIALYEVSRKINSHLDLKKLLDETMDLAIELLHAEKGLILFRNESSGELEVQVARLLDKRSIDSVIALSRSVIKKVEHEGKPVLLQRVPEADEATPSSLIRHKIKSVICVPLRSKEKLIGTIYLDTTDSKHFFKQEDLPFLEAFADLAGIAVDNARSYKEIQDLNENLEQKVEERTRALRQAQAQLIQSEKMASLGMLVAGVAHEINTPIGSLSSNSDMFRRIAQQLRQYFDEQSEHGDSEILQKLELLEKMAGVNKNACERISNIVKNLRNFARLDEGEIKTVDLHEGLDSTLALIDHLSRDRIRFVKEYGDLPKVRCYADQLNQVFMNILVNACQAIKERGEVRLKTFLKDKIVHIQISDTGVGIPPAHLQKIFDPGFTTKGVGVGTGLGLAICYKIISEHGGSIDVESEVGAGTTFTLKLPLEAKPQEQSVSG